MARSHSEAQSKSEVSERTPLKQDGERQNWWLTSSCEKYLRSIGSRWNHSSYSRLPPSILCSIAVTHHLLKGLVAGGGDEGLIGKPVEFLLGAQHVPAHTMQSLVNLGAFAPWILKPIIGVMSDAVPIYGYKRRPYMAIVTVFAIIAVACLALGIASTTQSIVAALFFASLQVATCTLLVDARRCEVAKEREGAGPELVTFTEVGMNFGIILSALLVGPLISYAGPRTPYFVAAPFVLAPMLLVLLDWLRDEQLPVSEQSPSLKPVRQNPCLFGIGFLLLPLLLVLACGSAMDLSQHVIVVLAATAAFVIIGGYSLFIRPEISGPVVFYFIFRCLNVQLSGALFYFFTDPWDAFPQGPHFSAFFYATVMTSVAILGRLFGFMTAKNIFGDWAYGKALCVTMPLAALPQLAMVPLLLRWNLPLGVPDQVWVLTCTFLEMVFRGWRMFPFSVVLLQATPRGLEASSFALNTGAANMGLTLSVFFGSYLLHLFEVHPAGHPGEELAFANLWKVQLAAALLPLLALPLLPLLIPRRSQNQTLILERPESATCGSVAEQCLTV